MSAKRYFKKLFITLNLLFFLSMASDLSATDLGVMGETYPILEMDFIDFIQSRASQIQQNGAWQSLQRHATQKAIAYRDRPTRVAGITRATQMKNWKYDPSIILDHDVVSPDGKLIAVAGTRVNPLHYISLKKALLFYSSDDEAQVKWALEEDKKLNGKDKLILVNGSVLNEEARFKKPIYFDQSGQLTSHFGITHVPAKIMQEENILRITEIKL